MLRCISVFFVVFICWACEVDYSFGEKDFKPRVVVNALISPQNPLRYACIGAAATRLKAGSLPLGKPKSACTKIIPRLCAVRPIRRARPERRSGLLRGAFTVLSCRSPATASYPLGRRFPKHPQPAYRSRTKRDGIGIST